MATLYHVPTSRSLRVLWTLEEIGATVEVKSLGVRPRLQEPEYLAINPRRPTSEPEWIALIGKTVSTGEMCSTE